MKIYLEKVAEILENGNWVSDPNGDNESRYIDETTFKNITCPQTVRFFKSLGGTEKITRKNGLITKLVSTSPDKLKRTIYKFKY